MRLLELNLTQAISKIW